MPRPELFVAGDLCNFAYLLGKEGMSSKWCPYCPLNAHEMTLKDHAKLPPWTIQKIIEMAAGSRKGADRLGVKSQPRLKCVPVSNYVLPEPHIGLGVDNATLEVYEDTVNALIVPMSPQESEMRDEFLQLSLGIDDARKKLKAFNESTDGKEWKKIDEKVKNAGKQMTNLEIAQLTELNAQRGALALARQAAKRGGDSGELETTTKALAEFDKSKTGGKMRANLMKKRKASQTVISTADRAKHQELAGRRKKLERERDGKIEKKQKLTKKLEANTRAKRIDGKGWFVEMDRIFAKHGVKREDYHKRKFSGRPLKKIKEKAKLIFDDAKVLLRQHKSPEVDDAAIDSLCEKNLQNTCRLTRVVQRPHETFTFSR